jgi:hypothetical protein
LEENYKLLTKNLDESSDIIEYKMLFQKKWSNNVYYSAEHLLHFEKNSDKLKYFLFEKDNEPIILLPFIFREIKINDKEHPYYDVVSPYGYSGPLFNKTLPEEDIAQFWSHLDKWYK